MDLSAFITAARARTEATLKHYLIQPTDASTLQNAMQYAVLNEGKRLRPLLVYLTGDLLGAPLESLDAPAAAIELIHAYSLIHDDLPAMDNADLRRGKPSCHIAFSEGTAILAGDALQPLAFEILAQHPADLTPEQRLKMISILSHVSGIQGMAAGQMLDLEGTTTLADLTRMYQLKTGALLNASITLGAIAAHCDPKILQPFAEHFGLAFQIQDDLLDIESTTTQLGKSSGIDQRNAKVTYPSLIGIEASRQKVQSLFEQALDTLDFARERSDLLRTFTQQLIARCC